jgi:transcriptional regulator of heat shock response
MDVSELVKDISPRQVAILKAIIEEYITTAEAVGSETLDKKHSLGVSPATIRNEMVRLTDMKLLKQLHTSAGRVPTPEALRFYVDTLMKPKDLSVSEEMSVKQKIWDHRQEIDKLLREATRALAERTKMLAITATSEGDLYYSGAVYVLDTPEFYDYELTHSLFVTLDQFDYWWGILDRQKDPIDILLGDEFGGKTMMSQCGFVYHKFTTPHFSGAVGVVGPFRLNYPAVVPMVRYVGDLVGELAALLA